MRIPDPIANTTTEAYLAYKAGVLSEGELKPKLYDPYIHLDAWLAYWAGLTKSYPVKNVGKNLFDIGTSLRDWFQTFHDGVDINSLDVNRTTATIENNKLVIDSYDNTGWTWLSRWVSLEKNTGYVISGKNTQAIRIVGFNSKELFAEGTLIKIKNKAPDGGTTTFNTGDYNYYALSFYPNGADDYFENIQIEKGSTATAYEPYTGEPEMLTDEEALIAYLSGVTNTYPEEFRDPADVRVAAYLKYLVSARWGRPEYPVTNEELYLSMMDAPYIPAGEPSSDIEIDDTAEVPFKDVKMYGDTSQTTYTGKNLLKLTPQASTSNGITATLADGIIKYSGTASTNWANIAARTANPIPAGDYMLSMQETFTTNYAYAISVTYTDSTTATFECWQSVDNKRTVTFAKDVASYYVYLTGLATNTSYSGTISLMLEAGSTATSFEPYVGGVPAPNPDYPQAVNTVTGRQMVRTIGENPLQLAQDTSGGGSYDATTNTYTSDTRVGANAWCQKIKVDGSNCTVVTKSVSNAEYRCVFSNTNVSTGAEIVTLTNGSGSGAIPAGTREVINSGNAAYFYISFRTIGTGQTATLENPIIWLPNQGNSYEINLGKNLLPATNGSETINGVVFTKNSDGSITANGTASAGINYYTNGFTYTKLKAGTYTLSDGVSSGESSDTFFTYLDGGPNYNSTLNNSTFELSQATNLRTRIVVRSGVTLNNVVFKVQLESGSTATSYAPYFTPIELCKIGDYQDYIYENDGKWYLHKEIGKLVQNGTEIGWYNISGSTSYARTNAATSFVKNVPFFANRGLTTPTSGTRIKIPNNNLYWYETGYESIEAFKSSLATTNLIVYAPLLTPTDTEITNTALIDQLNALKNGGSYTGTTYIKVSATDPNLPGLLKVEAYKYD